MCYQILFAFQETQNFTFIKHKMNSNFTNTPKQQTAKYPTITQFHSSQLLNQYNFQFDFNKNLKKSNIVYKTKSMVDLLTVPKIPTFLLNKHKDIPKQSQSHVRDEIRFFTEKFTVLEYSHKRKHSKKLENVYKSQIYIPDQERKKIFLIDQTKNNKLLKHSNRQTRLKTDSWRLRTGKNQKDKTGIEPQKDSIQDRRNTVSSVNSKSTLRQKKNNQLNKPFQKHKNHTPYFIKNKQIRSLLTNFPDSNAKTIKNMFQFCKNKKIRKLSQPDCYFDYRKSLGTKQIQISDFQFYEKLGKGAYGDVFLAKEMHTGFLCVIKKISKQKIKQHNLGESILRQIKIQSYINNKHLQPIYGVFNDKDYLYIILEFMVDGTLSYEIKKQKRMSESIVTNYILQICQAVAYMHNQSIIHRDIKPDNIFMHHNYLKLGDMGCAVQTETLRNTVVGCLAYVSPEQLGNKFYNEKIDIWSIGILTYEMLFGRAPFQKQLISMAKEQIEMKALPNLEFPLDIGISSEGRNFIECLLKTNPEQRPSIKQVLNHNFLTKYQQCQSQFEKLGIKIKQILNK